MKNNPHHTEFVINPYKTDSIVARVLYKKLPVDFITTQKTQYDLGINLIEVLGQIADRLPANVPGIMQLLDKQLKGRYPEASGILAYPGNVFTGDQSGFAAKV